MADVLTLFHDFASPASAIAVRRLQRLADEGAAIDFVGFEPFPLDVAVPAPLDVLGELSALAAAAHAEGVRLRRPSRLPSTGRAHVVGALADSTGLGASWREVAYGALWREDADLADPAVLVCLGARAGLDPDAVAAQVTDPVVLATCRRSMAAHRREGVGGVPTLLAHSTLVPGLLPESDLRALAAL